MLSNDCDNLQYSTIRESVIKVAQTCCFGIDANMEYEAKLKHDIQLTHQNYMKTEQDNSCLNLQVNELNSRLTDQNYQYASLKYELEMLNRQNFDLIRKLGEIPDQSDKNIQVNKSSRTKVMQKNASLKYFSHHFLDTNKLPKIFCTCGVQFKSNRSFQAHIRYHHHEVQFACTLCQVKRNGLNRLKDHMKRMHSVTEFTSLKGCRTCGKIFNTMEQIHEHKRREHPRKRNKLGSRTN